MDLQSFVLKVKKPWLIVRNKILELVNLITTAIIHSVKSSGTWKTVYEEEDSVGFN